MRRSSLFFRGLVFCSCAHGAALRRMLGRADEVYDVLIEAAKI